MSYTICRHIDMGVNVTTGVRWCLDCFEDLSAPRQPGSEIVVYHHKDVMWRQPLFKAMHSMRAQWNLKRMERGMKSINLKIGTNFSVDKEKGFLTYSQTDLSKLLRMGLAANTVT